MMIEKKSDAGCKAHPILAEFFWDLPAQMGECAFDPCAVESVIETTVSDGVIAKATRWRQIAKVFRKLPRSQQRLLCLSYTTPTHPLADGLKAPYNPSTGEVTTEAEIIARARERESMLLARARKDLGGDQALERSIRKALDAAPKKAERPLKDEEIVAIAEKERRRFRVRVARRANRNKRRAMAMIAIGESTEAFELQADLWRDLALVLERRADELRTLTAIVSCDQDLGGEVLALAEQVRQYLAGAIRDAAPATAALVREAHEAFDALWRECRPRTKAKRPKTQAEVFECRLQSVA